MTPGGCFTNVSRALQNNLAKIHNTRNHIYDQNFKLKLWTCAQSMALGTRTKFQLEILITSTISAIHKFRENILESSRNVSETTPWPLLQERWVSNIPHPKPPSPPPHTCFTKVPLCLIIQASKYIVYHFKNTSIITKQNTITNYNITCDSLIKFKMRMCDIEKILSWWYLRTSEWDVAPDNQTGCIVITSQVLINTLRPRQHGCHFADNLFRCIFLNEKCKNFKKISLKFVPKPPPDNMPALV